MSNNGRTYSGGRSAPNEYLPSERTRIMALFLAALYASRFSVRKACQLAGVDRSTVYRWRADDPVFARDWKLVLEALAEDCIEVVFNDALVEENVDSAKWTLERLLRRYGFHKEEEPEADEGSRSRRVVIVRASEKSSENERVDP